ncbi:MAG: porin [Cryomorphaceae bacterium]|jgi:porin
MKPKNNNQSRGRARAFSTAVLTTSLLGASAISATAKDVAQTELLEASMPKKESGITPYATLMGEVYTNHSGGISNGSAFAGLLDVGVEIDLEKLAGWKGASIFANAFYFEGDDITGKRIGDFNAATNLYTDTSFNIYNIFFQQSFGNGDSFFKLGQIALDDDFMVSESALLFINAGFGPLPVQSGNTAAPIYALAAPGGVIHYDIAGPGFVQAGVYVGDSGTAESGNQGFDWNTGNAAGWMIMAEAGFTYGENDGSVVKVGGYYHTGEYERFADGEIESGLYSMYAIIDHQLIAAEGCASLNVFFRGGFAPQDDIAVVSGYVEGGLVGRNVFKEDDALGFSASWTDLSDDFRLVEGGSSSETVLELTYQLPVNDWLTIQPDIQYIINPQGGDDDAFVSGLRAEISF